MAYIALGSDLGDRHRSLTKAFGALSAVRNTTVLAYTEIEETCLRDLPAHRHSLGQMAAVRTSLTPRALVATLHRIERSAGNVRAMASGPRTLELEVVMIEGSEIADDALATPHGALSDRELWRRQLAQLRGTTSG